MIEWMQRHKKWLVITIWVSTISFIAAGMVGWGSYNFSLSDGVVAKVGQLEITQRQLEERYRQLYIQYNTDGQLDAQKAKELGLEEIALKSLIEQSLLQNFALDLGLRVSHQEIIDEISKLDYFHKDGKFEPTLYKELLKQNNIKPLDFEEDVKNDLLIKKIANIIPFGSSTELEKKTFSFPFLVQDQVKIKILTHKDSQIKTSQEELKAFWEQHKQEFQYPSETKIEYVLVNESSQNPTQESLQELYERTKGKYTDSDGNIKDYKLIKSEIKKEQQAIMAEDKALREYITLKKSKEKYGNEKIMLEGDKSFGTEILEVLETGKIGEVFKPIKTSSGFIVVKILEKKPRTTKSFEDAKSEALVKLETQKKQEEIEKKAQDFVKNGFSGKNLGYITQEAQIDGLTQEENKIALAQIFTSSQKRNYISLQQKILIFEVTEQKLKQKPKESLPNSLIEFYKGQMISKEFYQYLQNQYKITTLKKEG